MQLDVGPGVTRVAVGKMQSLSCAEAWAAARSSERALLRTFCSLVKSPPKLVAHSYLLLANELRGRLPPFSAEDCCERW